MAPFTRGHFFDQNAEDAMPGGPATGLYSQTVRR